MKKNLMIAAVVALSLASCQNDEVVEIQQDQIKFSASTENASRGSEHYLTDLIADGFAVWGYVHGTNTLHLGNPNNMTTDSKFKNYAKASKAADGNFDTDVTAYWPSVGVDIEAIYPLDFSALVTENPMKYEYDYSADPEKDIEAGYESKPNSTFFVTVPTDVADQVDFLYATAYNAQKTDNNGIIALNFRHAMSQIKFNVGLQGDNLEAAIKSISFVNVDNHAGFNMPDKESSLPHYNDDPYTETDPATDNSEEVGTEREGYGWGTWFSNRADVSEKTTWNTEYGIFTQQTIRNVTIGDDVATTFGNYGAPDGYLPFPNATGTSMFLIPQTSVYDGESEIVNVAPATTDNIYLKVDCTINTVAADGTTRVKLFEGVMYQPLTVVWKQGMKYVYNLKFGREAENIRFSVTVDAYQTASQEHTFIVD